MAGVPRNTRSVPTHTPSPDSRLEVLQQLRAVVKGHTKGASPGEVEQALREATKEGYSGAVWAIRQAWDEDGYERVPVGQE